MQIARSLNSFLFSVVVAFSAMSLVACSMNSSSSPSKVTLNLSSMSGKSSKATALAAGDQIQHISISIGGAGMPQQVWQWDAHNKNDAPPGVISFNVPKGSARLIQVLLAKQTATGFSFQYGDTVVNISDSAPTIGITVSDLAVQATGEGGVSGRFIMADGSYPNGVVKMLFQPPGGKPKMLVQRSEVFGGYFNFFLLQGINFSYATENDQMIFPDVNALSPSLLNSTFTQATARLSVPAYTKSQNGKVTDNRSNSKKVVGFFGPGVSAKHKVCFNAPTANGDIYSSSSATWSQSYVTQASPVRNLTWSGTTPPDYYQVGVEAGSTTSCSGAKQFDSDTLLVLDEQSAVEGDPMFHVKGPFRGSSSCVGCSTSYANASYDSAAGNLTVSWQYAPDATAGIDGVEIFYRTGVTIPDNSEGDYKFGNGYACDQMARFGFVSAAQRGGFSSLTQMKDSFTIGGIKSDDVTKKAVQVVICPYRKDLFGQITYYQSGVEPYVSMGGGGGGGGGGQPASPVVGWKIMGNDPLHSDMNNQAVLSNATTLSAILMNTASAASFVPTISGQLISVANVTAIELKNGAGAWVPVSMDSGGPNYTNQLRNGNTVVGLPASTIASVLGVNSSSNLTVSMRVTIAAAQVTNLNLASSYVELDNLLLVGTTVCNPSLAVNSLLLNNGSSSVGSPSMFSDIFGVANGSDLSGHYTLQYQAIGGNCSGISVPIDYVSVFGTPVCFPQTSISRDPVDPFAINFVPQMISPANCSLASGTIGIGSYSSGGTASNTLTLSSQILNNSTILSRVGLYFQNTGGTLANMNGNYLSPRLMFSGPGNYMHLAAVGWNKSGQLTLPSRSSAVPLLASQVDFRTTNDTSLWASTFPALNTVNQADFQTAVSPANNIANAVGAKFSVNNASGAVTSTGGFELFIHNEAATTIEDLPTTLWGSQVMVASSATGVKIYLPIATNTGSYVGQTSMDITPPSGIAANSKVLLTSLPNGSGSQLFVLASGTSLKFGALYVNNGSKVSYSTGYTHTYPILAVVPYRRMDNTQVLLVVTGAASNAATIYELVPPNFDNNTGNWTEDYSPMSTAKVTISGSYSPIDFKMCQMSGGGLARPFLVTHNSSNYLSTVEISESGGTYSIASTVSSLPSAPAATLMRVSCFGQMITGGSLFHFLLWDKSGAAAPVIYSRAGSETSGGSINSCSAISNTISFVSGIGFYSTNPTNGAVGGEPAVLPSVTTNQTLSFVTLDSLASQSTINYVPTPTTCSGGALGWTRNQLQVLPYAAGYRFTGVRGIDAMNQGSIGQSSVAAFGEHGQMILMDVH